jgi:hypothetical protein
VVGGIVEITRKNHARDRERTLSLTTDGQGSIAQDGVERRGEKEEKEDEVVLER